MSERIQVVPAATRFRTRTDWLDSRSSFSFGEHYDPDNVGHGALVVSNDDVVATGRGFDDHPHRDAEILTWVLAGSLLHEDSAGHRGITHRGLAQRMTAGRGIVHAERNDAYRLDPDAPLGPVRFVQMWVLPDALGTDPSYDQHEVDLAELRRDWRPVASGSHPDAAVTLGRAGATLWVTVLEPAVARTLPVAPWVHLYVADGAVEVESVGRLTAGDAVRLWGEHPLRVTGVRTAELLVWQLTT
ncbi:MAG: pirin family protein [Propionibacteriaceae bacterium]